MSADLYNIYKLKPSSVMEMCIKCTTLCVKVWCAYILHFNTSYSMVAVYFSTSLSTQASLETLIIFIRFDSLVLWENIFYQLHPNLSKNRRLKSNMTERNDFTWQYEVTDRKTEQCGLMPPVHFSERKECLILTYCRRNVSEGRVIGIYIGRIMGGREHSVVVDSDSWTMTTERKNKHWFPPMWTHDRRHSEGKTTGGMWCAGMRQSDAELSARRRHWLSDATHHSHVYTWSLLHDYIIDINNIKQIQLKNYDKNILLLFFLSDHPQIYGYWLQQILSIAYLALWFLQHYVMAQNTATHLGKSDGKNGSGPCGVQLDKDKYDVHSCMQYVSVYAYLCCCR